MANTSVDFTNTNIAFHLKTDSELERAYFLFKMISNEPLVRIGTAATNFALKANLPVEGLIRSTVFDHFCGGVSAADCMSKISQMFQSGVSSVLDYSVEAKQEDSQFDFVVHKTKELIDFAAENAAIPFAVFKPTAIGRFELYQKITSKQTLNSEDIQQWNSIKARFYDICQYANDKEVAILVDAEESWMQDAADDLLLELMRHFNRSKVVVYNTLQAYRWDRLAYLKRINDIATKEGFLLGFKLVRGAYMEKERARALAKQYKSPICVNKTATDDHFNSCLEYILDHLKTISVFIGTHNEKSTMDTIDFMTKNGISKNDPRIWFGQLYGMSDHISFNLADAKFNVAKYLPFGPIKDVMPYLIRRAEENTSVSGQTSRELSLIKAEKKRRKL